MTNPRKYADKTRGKPFGPGNPGKPKGARHCTTILAEKLMQDDVEGIVKAVVTAAKAGDMAVCRIVLDRLAPVRRGRPVTFDLPPGAEDAGGLAAAFDAVLSAVAVGELTPEEGASVATVLEARRKAIETAELEARLTALEQRTSQ